jgi:hypothetical protein
MSKCKNCNCICHCSLKEHSDAYGVCPCQACSCSSETIVDSKASIIKEKVFGGVTVVDSTDDCESCQ